MTTRLANGTRVRIPAFSASGRVLFYDNGSPSFGNEGGNEGYGVKFDDGRFMDGFPESELEVEQPEAETDFGDYDAEHDGY